MKNPSRIHSLAYACVALVLFAVIAIGCGGSTSGGGKGSLDPSSLGSGDAGTGH